MAIYLEPVKEDPTKVAASPQEFLGGQAFKSYMAAVKEGGARFSPAHKCQVFPLDCILPVQEALQRAGFAVKVAPELAANLQAKIAQTKTELAHASVRMAQADALLEKRGLAMFPYQRGDVERQSTMGHCFNANPMGSGKTLETLMSLPGIIQDGQAEELASVLVVCPVVAAGVWKRETKKWRPDYTPVVIKGKKNFRLPRPGEIVIVSYDSTPSAAEFKTEWAPLCSTTTVLVYDEIHNIKGSIKKVARVQRCDAVSDGVDRAGGRIWGLSGTPMLNRPQELWNVLQRCRLATKAFGTWNRFVEIFDGYPGQWGGYSWGTPDEHLVTTCLQRVMIRHELEEILPQLPGKTRIPMTLELTPEAKRAFSSLLDPIVNARGITMEEAVDEVLANEAVGFEELQRASRLIEAAKIPAVLELVEEFEETDEPIIVCSNFKDTVEAFRGRKGWALITGDTSATQRTAIEEQFQAGDLKGIACTIKAAGVAITLTRARYMVFVGRDWTPALNLQMEDRIHRIGQNQGCMYYLLMWDHELEFRRAALLAEKMRLIEGSVEATGRRTAVEQSIRPDTALEQALAAVEVEARWNPADPTTHQKKKTVVDAATGQVKEVEPTRFRHASTPVEHWAHQGVLQLAALDPDRAGLLNDMGFNGTDGPFGHSVAAALSKGWGLSDRQWEALIKMLTKYHRQIGVRPGFELTVPQPERRS